MDGNVNFIAPFSNLFFFIFPDLLKKWWKIKINKLINKMIENIFSEKKKKYT